jgi:hypothetical protein
LDPGDQAVLSQHVRWDTCRPGPDGVQSFIGRHERDLEKLGFVIIQIGVLRVEPAIDHRTLRFIHDTRRLEPAGTLLVRLHLGTVDPSC